jgi:hypothetical protein
MRNRWEDTGDGGLDDPVTLTERQLRSLKRGARAGVFAFILALAAAGLAGWTSVQGGKLNLPSLLHPSAERGSAPVTENFAASPPPSATLPARDPVPVSAESRRPATRDSSAAHH